MTDIEDIFSPSHPSTPPASHNAAAPQRPPGTPPQYGGEFPAPHKRSHKGLLWGMITALAILLFGGTAFGMYQGWIPMPEGLFKTRIATALAASVEKLMAMESARYTVNLTANVTTRDTDATPILFSELEKTYTALNGTTPSASTSENVSSVLPDNLLIDLTFSGLFSLSEDAASIADTENSISADIAYDAFTFMLGMDIRVVDQILYVRLTTLPERVDPFLAFIGLEAKDIHNTWISFESTDELSDFNISIPKPENTVESEKAIPTLQAVTKALLDADLLSIEKTLPDEDIGGVMATHLRVGIHPEKAPAAYRAAVAAAQQENPTAGIVLDEKIIKLLEDASFQKFYTSLEANSALDIWIDESRNLPVKISSTTRFIPEIDAEFPGKQLNIGTSFMLTDIDQPITVEKPAMVTPFSELLPTKNTEGIGLGLTNTFSGDSTDTDGDQIPDYLEESLGTDPNLADTDGDGYDDYTEFINGFNPLGEGTMDENSEGLYPDIF